jgi:hypothetical protein
VPAVCRISAYFKCDLCLLCAGLVHVLGVIGACYVPDEFLL